MVRVTLLLLVAVFGMALGESLPKMPNQFSAWQGRIVGGQTAANGQFPHQCSLRSAENFHFCGCSIVNTRWVVSAAHCTVNAAPSSVRVVVGAHHRINGGTQHVGSQIINHPDYSAITLINDISVVQTVSVIGFGPGVSAIPLGINTVQSGQAQVSGWGQTTHPGSAAENLQFLNKQVITNDECRAAHSIINGLRVFPSTLCTSTPVGQGTCMGDSGGPLILAGELIGIVSWGIPCGTAAPDAYVRVSSFRTWILGLTG